MAVKGVSNLAELISYQSLTQNQNNPAGSQLVQVQSSGGAAPTQDTFTPSSQNASAPTTAQDAGLFQVSQFALVSATATDLAARTAAQNSVPAQIVQPTAPIVAAEPPATNTVAAAPQITANAATLDVPSIQGQLQSLNTTLLGLGLTNSDIQVIDRIASSINDFNPIEYADLVRQFQAQAAQQTANAATGPPPPTVPKAPTT